MKMSELISVNHLGSYSMCYSELSELNESRNNVTESITTFIVKLTHMEVKPEILLKFLDVSKEFNSLFEKVYEKLIELHNEKLKTTFEKSHKLGTVEDVFKDGVTVKVNLSV